MTSTSPRILLAASLAAALACGGSDTQGTAASGNQEAAGGEETSPVAAAPATFTEQVAMGQELYGQHCASCHGAGGEGTDDAPRVVGLAQGALPLDPPAGARGRTTQFRTVADVAAFVVANMPPGRGGSLTTDQYYAILAFDLKANGVDLPQVLDGALAPTLNLPGR